MINVVGRTPFTNGSAMKVVDELTPRDLVGAHVAEVMSEVQNNRTARQGRYIFRWMAWVRS